MSLNRPEFLNRLWMARCRRDARAFDAATRDVAGCQWTWLRAMLARNGDTAFGREYDFGSIPSVEEYQRRVPVMSEEALAGYVGRIAAGEAGVLTTEPVRLLEPTSGSTNARKLIPYTDSLRREFQAALNPWIADTFGHFPGARRGRAYWSLSPAGGEGERTDGGVPIGFDDDTAYLGVAERWIARRILAVPSTVTRLRSMENFRYVTALHLAAAADLSLVSVWSPTFFLGLLADLERWGERLADDLRRGTVSLPEPASDPAARFHVPARPDAARILRGDLSRVESLQAIWPRLALISAWADGASAPYAKQLRARIPFAAFQPKGLLATEGVVSFPLAGEEGAALALRSHFFEFVDDSGACRTAHEVEPGESYEVILTTGGGLYRYPLGDRVEVVGLRGGCPLLRFLGRGGGGSDLVGEKLAEAQVGAVLARCLAGLAPRPSFAMVAPAPGGALRYRLYLQFDTDSPSSAMLNDIAARVDAGLAENPYYAHARAVGQLGPLEAALVAPARGAAWSLVEQRALRAGRRLGDIKPHALDPCDDWDEFFA